MAGDGLVGDKERALVLIAPDLERDELERFFEGALALVVETLAVAVENDAERMRVDICVGREVRRSTSSVWSMSN